MNTKLVIHLILTETRKNLFFILALWLLVLAFPRDSEIGAIAAFFLIARLAMGDHITRPNAIWQRLPLSMLDWLVSRLTLLALWMVLPVLIQQGWVAHHTLLSPAATTVSLLEAGTLTFLFSVSALAIFSLAQRWVPTVVVSGCMVCLCFLLEISIDYATEKPPGVQWMSKASLHPSPEPRWLVLALTIMVAITFMLFYRRMRSLQWGIPVAIFGFVLLYCAIIWAETNDSRVVTNRAPETFHLSNRNLPEGSPTNTQKIYENVQLSGLGGGAFVEPIRIIVDGKKRYLHKLDNDYYAGLVKRFYRDQALGRHFSGKGTLFRSDGNNTIFHRSYESIEQAPQLNFTQSIQNAHDDKSISRVKLRGEARKWMKVHEMPLQNGSFQSNFNISGRFKIEETKGRAGMRTYFLTLYQPQLSFSTEPTMSLHTNGWGGINSSIVVIFNEALGECILPGLLDVRSGYAPNIFGLINEKTRKFEIPTNDAWKVLWPEGDATDKWLEGARLQIYTTRYLGRFEDEIYLSGE